MLPYDLMNVALAVNKMRQNSAAWYKAEPAEQQRLSNENQALAQKVLKEMYHIPVIYNPDGGTWHVGAIDGPLLYNLY